MADLNGTLSGSLIRGEHPLSVLHRERHRLFLIDVLAGVQCRDEVLAVQVLGRGDEHCVDALVLGRAHSNKRRNDLLMVGGSLLGFPEGECFGTSRSCSCCEAGAQWGRFWTVPANLGAERRLRH